MLPKDCVRSLHMNVHKPPDTKTPSELTASVLTMAWCPVKFCMKLPSGSFHIFILSGDPLAKQNLKEYEKEEKREKMEEEDKDKVGIRERNKLKQEE